MTPSSPSPNRSLTVTEARLLTEQKGEKIDIRYLYLVRTLIDDALARSLDDRGRHVGPVKGSTFSRR
jgi:hypothetical protein